MENHRSHYAGPHSADCRGQLILPRTKQNPVSHTG